MIMTVGIISFTFGASIAGLIVGAAALKALHERDGENEALCTRVQELTFKIQYLRGELENAHATIRANAEEQKLAA